MQSCDSYSLRSPSEYVGGIFPAALHILLGSDMQKYKLNRVIFMTFNTYLNSRLKRKIFLLGYLWPTEIENSNICEKPPR